MASSSTMTTLPPAGSLRILVLDGGGMKGLTSLLVLQRIFRTLSDAGSLEKPPRPCEVFDLIVGTSTGGLIAIMLGRLGMTIEQAINQYEDVGKRVFGAKSRLSKEKALFGRPLYDIKVLQECIKDAAASQDPAIPPDTPFRENGNPKCKVMVCAVRKASTEPERIRSYQTKQADQANYDCKIWEAASATSAASVYFKEVTFSANGEVWVDGALGSNNPIFAAVAEAENEPGFAGREIGCVISIGTGRRRKEEFPSHVAGVYKAAVGILTNSETMAEQFAATPQGKQLQSAGKYFRFNVAQGMQQFKLDDWNKRVEMSALTDSYLGGQENASRVRSCAEVLWDPDQNHFADPHPPQRSRGMFDPTSHEALVKSLKYDRMNERRQQIDHSAECRFGAIFDNERDSNEGDSSEGDPNEGDSSEAMFGDERDSSQVFNSEAITGKGPVFCDWLQSPDQPFFWITGKPGSGKSTLLKYLAFNEQTLDHLNQWNVTTRILSHFVWMNGSDLQRSFRGILLSLLYQLLVEDAAAAATVLQRFPQTGNKESDADWSAKELADVACFVFGISTRAICIFLDGLDELRTEQEQRDTLKLVERLCELPQLKICVSSRPEPLLNHRLRSKPHLRVQDVTEGDIWAYATNILSPYFGYDGPADDLRSHALLEEKGLKDLAELVRTVSEKAGGVFLWVSLALGSLVSGLDREDQDSGDKLLERLAELPEDLNKLFQDMWERQNKNNKVHNSEGAGLLNLVLDIPEINRVISQEFSQHQPRLRFERCRGLGTVTSAILLATNQDICQRLLSTADPLSAMEELEKKVSVFSKSVKARSAGLLEVTSHGIELIHRSATDFLQDHAEGQAILRNDKTTRQDRAFNLIKAWVALTRCIPAGSDGINNNYSSRTWFKSAVQYVYIISILLGHNLVAKERALYCMDLVETLPRRTISDPYTAGYGRDNGILSVGFIGLIALSGGSFCLSLAIQRLEENVGALPQDYLEYLLVCSIQPDVLIISVVDDSKTLRADVIDGLFRRGNVNLNARTINGRHLLTDRAGVLSRVTLMMVFLEVVLSGGDTFAHISKTMDNLVILSPNLKDRTVIVLRVMAKWEWAEVEFRWDPAFATWGWRGDQQEVLIVLEASVAFLLKLYMRIADIKPSHDLQTLVVDASMAPGFATVLGIWDSEEWRFGDEPRDQKLFIPKDEHDSATVLRVFDTMTPTPSLYSTTYRLTNLKDALLQVKQRATQSTTMSEIENGLLEKGILVRECDVKDWPPSPHG